MGVQLAALDIFVGVFVVATLRKLHTGVLMYAAAAAVGVWLAGMTMKKVVAGFPVGILVLLVVLTYFFALAQASGAIDRITGLAIAKVGDRAFFLPVAFFALTAGISATGSPLAGLVVGPMVMTLANKYNFDRMLMAIAMGSGISAGAFAPTSLFGIVTYRTARAAGIGLDPLVLFTVALGASLLLVAAAYVLFGGFKLLNTRAADGFGNLPRFIKSQRKPSDPFERDANGARSRQVAAHGVQVLDEPGAAAPAAEKLNRLQIIPVLCVAGLVPTAIVMALLGGTPDIGILCFAFASILTLRDPKSGKTAVSKKDRSAVLLVGGIITFVGVLQAMGAVALLGKAAAGAGTPLVTALVICALGGMVSAFASTTGMLAALVPLALPLVACGAIAGWAVIAARGVCSSSWTSRHSPRSVPPLWPPSMRTNGRGTPNCSHAGHCRSWSSAAHAGRCAGHTCQFVSIAQSSSCHSN